MDEVLQTGRRKPRPWTAQEQVTAEVAAACGLTFSEIGCVLDRSYGSVQYRIDLNVANKTRNRSRQWCQDNRELSAALSRIYYYRNHEERKAKNRAWNYANKDRVDQCHRLWRQKNRNKVIENVKRWRQQNLDRHRENNRKWSAKNRDAVLLRRRQWRINNREKSNDIVRRRRARLRANGAPLCRITFEAKQARFLLWRNLCAYCSTKDDLTVDHVLAVKRHGIDEPTNIVPACRRCNSSKNASPVETWYRRQPFFTEARWRKIQRHCPAAVVGQLPLAFAA